MRHSFFYVLLSILVVLDGWLLAHPNLIGQAGVFFFEYTYLETFPKALGTVAAVVIVASVVAWAVRKLGRTVVIGALVALLALSGYWLFDSFTLYNSGIYKLTGAGFRAGAILLPGLVTLVFGRGLFEVLQSNPIRR